MTDRRAFRASILHCLDDPGEHGRDTGIGYFEDGILFVEDGIVVETDDAEKLLARLPDNTLIESFPGQLIVPGFIDCHVHFPQLDIVASYGEQLLDWLQRYAYPAEIRFADIAYATSMAETFVNSLLANGTTTALVCCTVHAHSVDAIFNAAKTRDMRLIAGKVLMDRNCPESLRDTAESAYDDSRALIERWHEHGRLGYAITPRFALTSSDAQLEAAGRLASEYPDVWVHTHLAENVDEIERVRQLFPKAKSYLDVYDRVGLARQRSVFAHCLHLNDADRQAMAAKKAAVAFCPSSNLFLGSGLFNLRTMTMAGVEVGLGSDVGGGPSLSMLKTIGDAYKILQLSHQSLPAMRGLYLTTLGAARALDLDEHIGNFAPGKEADFVVIDPAASPATARRTQTAESIEEMLFALALLGDERNIGATYLRGQRCALPPEA